MKFYDKYKSSIKSHDWLQLLMHHNNNVDFLTPDCLETLNTLQWVWRWRGIYWIVSWNITMDIFHMDSKNRARAERDGIKTLKKTLVLNSYKCFHNDMLPWNRPPYTLSDGSKVLFHITGSNQQWSLLHHTDASITSLSVLIFKHFKDVKQTLYADGDKRESSAKQRHRLYFVLFPTHLVFDLTLQKQSR